MNNNYYMDLVHNNFDDNFLQDKICPNFSIDALLFSNEEDYWTIPRTRFI